MAEGAPLASIPQCVLQEVDDRASHALVGILLRRPPRLQRRLRHQERVVASVDDMEARGRAHALSYILEKLERTEGIARSLHEQDRRLKLEQDLVS